MEPTTRTPHGFTLHGLAVVLVALESLAAFALPRLASSARDARVERVGALASVVRHTVESVHTACLADPRCDVGHDSQFIVVQGRYERVNHGWLDAAHAAGNGEIDAWVHHNGFTVSLPDASRARFSADDAPAPARCGVTYLDADRQAAQPGVRVSESVDGC